MHSQQPEVSPAVQARLRFDMLETAMELVKQAHEALRDGTLTDGLIDCIRDVHGEMEDNLTFFERHRMCGRETLATIHNIRTWAENLLDAAEEEGISVIPVRVN